MKTTFSKTVSVLVVLTILINPITTAKAEDWNEYIEENQRLQEQVSELEKEVSELKQEVSKSSENKDDISSSKSINSESTKTADKKRNLLLFSCFLSFAIAGFVVLLLIPVGCWIEFLYS